MEFPLVLPSNFNHGPHMPWVAHETTPSVDKVFDDIRRLRGHDSHLRLDTVAEILVDLSESVCTRREKPDRQSLASNG